MAPFLYYEKLMLANKDLHWHWYRAPCNHPATWDEYSSSKVDSPCLHHFMTKDRSSPEIENLLCTTFNREESTVTMYPFLIDWIRNMQHKVTEAAAFFI